MREVVLDTNVLVSALRSKEGASYLLLRRIGMGNWRLNISVALALEYEDVLKRKGLLSGFSGMEIDGLLEYIFRVSNLEPFVLRHRPSLRDPNDERILEVAMQCHATIVTHNTKDFAGVERLSISVKTPAEFLAILKEDQ